MMKRFSKVLLLSMAILAVSVFTVNAQSYSADLTEVELGQKIRKQILKLPYYEVFDYIGYSIDGKTVTLYGSVLRGSTKSGAEAAVKRIDGVEKVVNNIEVQWIGGFDSRIRRDVYISLANMAGLSRYLQPVNPSIRIIVDRGRVTLEGYVANEADKDLANIAARSVPNTFAVTNNLVVDRERAM